MDISWELECHTGIRLPIIDSSFVLVTCYHKVSVEKCFEILQLHGMDVIQHDWLRDLSPDLLPLAVFLAGRLRSPELKVPASKLGSSGLRLSVSFLTCEQE